MDRNTEQMVRRLAQRNVSHGGPVESMGVPWFELPSWEELRFRAAEPREAGENVDTRLILGTDPKHSLELDIPLLVSDMSFGSLSSWAKVALAEGAAGAGAGTCSGEGGILEGEMKANPTRYLFELGSGKFGFGNGSVENPDHKPLWCSARAFHVKGGQAAKTGTGGHLPGQKVTEAIAKARGKPVGKDIISPPTFEDLDTPEKFRDLLEKTVLPQTGPIPVGFKLSANHIENDIRFALDAGADYIILDGRGGSTGAAPILFRDHISVSTIPALVRARAYLGDKRGTKVKLIITGGLRTPLDFAKALALGADGVAIANSALQALGCIAARQCHTNNCPMGIATQRPDLEKNFPKDAAKRLTNFLVNSTRFMKSIARACGYSSLADLNPGDLESLDPNMHRLTGVSMARSPR